MAEESENPETLVAGRAKRATAGNRMARLLNQEEGSDDEFYKEYYGENVFLEDDSEFTTEEESEESDEFDSDFFTEDEGEEPVPEEVEDTGKAKRRRNVYVDPLAKTSKKAKTTARKPKSAKVQKRTSSSSSSATARRAPNLDRELRNLASSTGFRDKVEILPEEESESARRRSRRRAVVKRMEEVEKEKQKKKKTSQSRKLSQERPKPTQRKMTLAERLVEAVETERQNMASLQEFYKTKEERKRAASKLKTFNGPRVRYRSFTTKDSEGKPCSRSVVSFSDEDTLKSAFDPRRAVDTRPFFTTSEFLPPDPPLSGLGIDHDQERDRSADGVHDLLYPEHVSPHMNIFKTLGFGR